MRFDFDEVFDEDYLYFYGPLLEDSSDADAELIWRLCALRPGTEVLDLGCGHGRIANRLAERDVLATGLDASELFIDRARSDAERRGVDATYVRGDMRSLPFDDGAFECVISWFTAFGYFSDEANRGVLSEIHRVLRPGGTCLIENNNLVELLARWAPAVVSDRDGNFVLDRSKFDPVTGRASTERVVVRDGGTRRFQFSVRMFVAVELRDWLRAAGFDAVESYGPDGEELTDRSRRMITVARR